MTFFTYAKNQLHRIIKRKNSVEKRSVFSWSLKSIFDFNQIQTEINIYNNNKQML